MNLVLYSTNSHTEIQQHRPLDYDALTEDQACAIILALKRALKPYQIEVTQAWPLSVRASNVLRKNHLTTVSDLQSATEGRVSRLMGCGAKTLEEIVSVAREAGVTLPRWERVLREQLIKRGKAREYEQQQQEREEAAHVIKFERVATLVSLDEGRGGVDSSTSSTEAST